MVVRDHRVARLGDELGQRQAQGQVDGDGQGVLDDEHFQAEAVRKFVQMLFEVNLVILDAFGDARRADVDRKEILVQLRDLRVRLAALVQAPPLALVNDLVDGVDLRMAVMGFGDQVADLRRAVALPTEVKAGVSHAFQDRRPLLGFERNPIRARKAGGDKPNAP